MRSGKYHASVPLTNQAVNAHVQRYPLLSLTNQPAEGIALGATRPEKRVESLSARGRRSGSARFYQQPGVEQKQEGCYCGDMNLSVPAGGSRMRCGVTVVVELAPDAEVSQMEMAIQAAGRRLDRLLARVQTNSDAVGEVIWEIRVDRSTARAHQHASGRGVPPSASIRCHLMRRPMRGRRGGALQQPAQAVARAGGTLRETGHHLSGDGGAGPHRPLIGTSIPQADPTSFGHRPA